MDNIDMHASVRLTCPRCGLKVYKTKLAAHDRKCAVVVEAFGGPKELAALFAREPSLCLEDLAAQLPPGHGDLLRRMAVTGGVSVYELTARRADRESETQGEAHGRARRRHRCGRCWILLDAKGVPPGRDASEGLCGWCDGSVPPIVGTAATATGATRPGAGWKKSWRSTL
jgi:hypothetical protein